MPWACCTALPCLQIWGRLTRQVAPEVSRSPELYTMLPVPNPFVIPGARFREVSCRMGGLGGGRQQQEQQQQRQRKRQRQRQQQQQQQARCLTGCSRLSSDMPRRPGRLNLACCCSSAVSVADLLLRLVLGAEGTAGVQPHNPGRGKLAVGSVGRRHAARPPMFICLLTALPLAAPLPPCRQLRPCLRPPPPPLPLPPLLRNNCGTRTAAPLYRCTACRTLSATLCT